MNSATKLPFLLVLALAACGHKSTPVSADYYSHIHAWQEHRNTGLRSPDGWLTLVGLFWLKPGDNTIGSDPSNDFVLPKSAPARLGRLTWKQSEVFFTDLAAAAVFIDGKPQRGPLKLSYSDDNPDVVRSGTISFFLIKRGDRLGVRAKDSGSPQLKNFRGMEYFPTNPELHFAAAKMVPNVRKIPILNILGQTSLEESPGVVEFVYRGDTYRLRPIYEGDMLFFLFKDPTNKTTTYQAGRMLDTPLPRNGLVDLDFNLSYNPPCTFTPYATCPLPPKENMLTFPVEAGEKRYGSGHASAGLQ